MGEGGRQGVELGGVGRGVRQGVEWEEGEEGVVRG